MLSISQSARTYRGSKQYSRRMLEIFHTGMNCSAQSERDSSKARNLPPRGTPPFCQTDYRQQPSQKRMTT